MTDREFNTAVFMLRSLEIGLRLSEMHLISVGMVADMLIEHDNDSANYARLATQEDFDTVFH